MHTGPNIVNDGLVFGMDTGYGVADNNTPTRHFKGKPSENLLSLAGSNPETERSGQAPQYSYYGVNITSYVQSRWSSGNNTLVQSFEGKRDYVVGGTGGGNDGYPRMYVYFSDWSWSNSFGITSYDWSFNKQAFTMPDPAGKTIYMNIYHMNSQNPGVSYSRNHKVEFGNIATPFVNGSRSSTQSLIDLTRTTTIDVSNVSFDSDGQPTFDGTDDHITMPDNPNNGDSAASWEFVVKFDKVHDNETSTYRQIYIQEASIWIGQYYDNIGIDLRKDNNAWFDGNGGIVTSSQIGPVNSNTWYHGLFTFDNGVIKGYLNGILEFTTTQSGMTQLKNGNAPRRIGRRSSQPLDGKIPVFKIYNRALSAQEVQQNYNAYKNRFDI